MHFNTILKRTIGWKLANTICLFSINLLMVRLLGAKDSGSFFYDIAVLSFLLLVVSGCLESGITYYASKNNGIIASVLIYIVPLLLLQSLVSWIILQYVELTIDRRIALLFVISNLSFIYIVALFHAKKWFIYLNIISCTINLATIGILFYWWYGGKTSATNDSFIFTYVINVTLQAFVLLVAIAAGLQIKKLAFSALRPVIKKVFIYSSISFLSNIVFFLVTRIDYYFVQKFCTGITLSNYVQVSKFGQLLVLVPSIIASVIVPFSAGDSNKMPIGKVQELCRGITLVFIPLSIVIISTANWIFPWMFGEGFSYMYIALLFYLPGFFLLSILTVLAAHLAGNNVLGANLVSSCLALVVVIAGDMVLIPSGGINAAAIVSSAGYACACAYLVYACKNKFDCTIRDFFIPTREDLKNFLRNIK